MAAGLIPLYNPVNAGIMLLNGGYLFSQLSDQIKKFLLLVNNKQYENLKVYDRPKVYVKLGKRSAYSSCFECFFTFPVFYLRIF